MAVSTWDGDIATKQALDLTGSENVSISDNDRYAFGTNDFTLKVGSVRIHLLKLTLKHHMLVALVEIIILFLVTILQLVA